MFLDLNNFNFVKNFHFLIGGKKGGVDFDRLKEMLAGIDTDALKNMLGQLDAKQITDAITSMMTPEQIMSMLPDQLKSNYPTNQLYLWMLICFKTL